jgi:hypothetical protein
MSPKTEMKIQIAMNQKKNTIIDAKMSLKVIAQQLPRTSGRATWTGLRDGRATDGPSGVAGSQV